MVLAWHIEALHRQKKLPSLAALLRRGATAQSVDQQRTVLTLLSETFGGRVTTKADRDPPSVDAAATKATKRKRT